MRRMPLSQPFWSERLAAFITLSGLNTSPFTTPWPKGGETIREEIMRRLCCCKIHPALPLEMIGPNRNVYTNYKMFLKFIHSCLECGLHSVNDFIITIQSLLVIDPPERGGTSETHTRTHTDILRSDV